MAIHAIAHTGNKFMARGANSIQNCLAWNASGIEFAETSDALYIQVSQKFDLMHFSCTSHALRTSRRVR